MTKFKKNFQHSKGMSKRIKKLEDDVTPLLKTFEQRFVDNAPALTGDVSVDSGGLFYSMGKLAPTTQDNSFQYGGGAVQPQLPQNLRVGDKITVKSYRLRGQIKCALGTAIGDSNNQVRLMAVLIPDWGSISAAATAATLLKNVLQAYGGSYSVAAPMYSPYKNRTDQDPTGNQSVMIKYRVLYDRKFNLVNTISAFTGGNGSGGAAAKECWRHDFDINLKFKKGLVCHYQQTGNLIDPDLNNIVILAVSDSVVAAHPTIQIVSRMKYIDA